MFSICSRVQALVGTATAVVSFTLLSTAYAGHIPAGLDYFETVPNGTYIDFSQNPIPHGFFDPGSDPFIGLVPLQGIPLAPSTLGTTDTIVQRLSDIHITQHGGPVMIPIEIVALSLVSVNPITVTYNGGQNPEFWNVHVSLPNNQQQAGSMTIRQTSPQGGTWDSTLPVMPDIIFTRISDNQMRSQTPPLVFDATAVPWSHKAEHDLLVSPHFCPICDNRGARLQAILSSMFAFLRHEVQPATRAQ